MFKLGYLNYGAMEIGFYPASLMDKTIRNNPSALFNDNSYSIQSVDWVASTITIDKDIVLPLFEEIKTYANCKTWQIHVKTKQLYPISSYSESLLQLDSVVGPRTFHFDTTGQILATLQANFVAPNNISFRNPHTFWKPLAVTPICPPSTGLPSGVNNNRFPSTLFKDTNKYKSLGYYNDSTDAGARCGYSESTDFVTWTNATAITPTNPIPWQKVGLNIANFYTGHSNIIDSNGFKIVPIITFANDMNKRRIGLMKVPDGFDSTFSPVTANFSTKYIFKDAIGANATYNDYATYPNMQHVACSMCKFKTKYYFALDLYYGAGDRKCVIFEMLYTDINTISLTKIQEIVRDNPLDDSWKNYEVSNPMMFVYNEQLFMFIQGSESTYSLIYPNKGNVNGLWELNKQTGLFEEYISNPIILNPYKNFAFTGADDHSGISIAIQDGDRLLSLLTFNSGTNTYRIFPAELNIKYKEIVNKWVNDNKI